MTPLAYLRQRGTWATQAWVMARDLHMPKRQAARTLQRMHRMGDAVVVRRGYYLAAGIEIDRA
jgi:hypothetical protein